MCSSNLCQAVANVLAHRKKVRNAGLFSLLVAPLVGQSAETYNSSLSVYAQRNDHTFTEYNERDVVLMREQGVIDHYGLSFHWQLDSGVFVAVKTERGKGSAQYRGFDQTLQYIERRTEYVITEQNIYLGRQFGNNEARVGIGSQYRERNIVDGKLYEELDWRFASFGLAKRIPVGTRWQLKLFGEAGLALDSQLQVEFDGKYDPVEMAPGRITSATAGVELLYKVTPKFTIGLTPIYKFTQVEQGDDYPLIQKGREIGVAAQPRSEYETLTWELKLSKMF